jgi:dienelactone hydrolase
MDSLHFTTQTSTDGVLERVFTVGDVPGVLWSPGSDGDGSPDRAPLVLLGHGGGNHKQHPAMVGRARRLALAGGFHVACIDAPGHGDRPRTQRDWHEITTISMAMDKGEPVGPIVVRYNAHLAERAVPEWRATLDALQQLPEIGTGGRIGYYGINMGTAIGVPLVAADPRFTAAVFGQFWPALAEAATQIGIPVEFVMQWDDEHITRQDALALFDAFASTEKSLHANSGEHKELPRFEADSAVRFFVRHLRQPVTAPA